MAARIRTTCPDTNGAVEVSAVAVEVTLARHADGTVDGDRTSYRFDCPGCRQRHHKAADAKIVRMLRSGGVLVVDLSDADRLLTAALPHPEPHPAGAPPIDADDLLDFVVALHDTNLLAARATNTL